MGKNRGSNSDNLMLREIYKKLLAIEEEVEKLKGKPEYHINIEKLDVQQLENLSFTLDKLDIKEVSGTLNIGNNFDSQKQPANLKTKAEKRRSHDG
jgi:hypothetical protein